MVQSKYFALFHFKQIENKETERDTPNPYIQLSIFLFIHLLLGRIHKT